MRSTFRSQSGTTTAHSNDFWAFKRRFYERHGGIDFAPLQNRAERVGFVAVSEMIAGVGGLKGSANMHLAWKAHIIASFLRLAMSNFGGSLAELLRLLMLSTSSFKGSLAEFLRFRCGQLSEVSHTCFL